MLIVYFLRKGDSRVVNPDAKCHVNMSKSDESLLLYECSFIHSCLLPVYLCCTISPQSNVLLHISDVINFARDYFLGSTSSERGYPNHLTWKWNHITLSFFIVHSLLYYFYIFGHKRISTSTNEYASALCSFFFN